MGVANLSQESKTDYLKNELIEKLKNSSEKLMQIKIALKYLGWAWSQ